MHGETRIFTQKAERVLALAQTVAEQQGSKTIDTEHLLLALLNEDEVTREFLQALGLGEYVLMQDITNAIRSLKDASGAWLGYVRNEIEALRSPVGAIKSYIEILQKVSLLGGKGQHCIERIVESTDRVMVTIKAAGDWLRPIDATKFAREPFDLKTLLDQVIADLDGVASDKSVHLSFDCSADVFQVWGMKRYMYFAAQALVDNSIRHSPIGQEVKVTMSRSMSGIQLRIQTWGPSIPESELPHIFAQRYGTGNPLATVKAIVEAHGGKVEARNLSKQGTEFVAMFPVSIALPQIT